MIIHKLNYMYLGWKNTWKNTLLNKVPICIFFVYKKYSDWTTDGRWTILTMSFILFWALTVLFTWQSMEQSQASLFHHKYLKLCSEDKQRF